MFIFSPIFLAKDKNQWLLTGIGYLDSIEQHVIKLNERLNLHMTHQLITKVKFILSSILGC